MSEAQDWERCSGCGKEFAYPHLCREHMLCGGCHPAEGNTQEDRGPQQPCPATTRYGTCAVCGKEPAVGIASIPGVPASDAYGRACLEANAHPMWALVANTALIGGLFEAAEWWREMVEDTLEHLGVSRETFDRDVTEAMKELE